MRKKHWLRRREVYLPRGVCFSTEVYLPKGVRFTAPKVYSRFTSKSSPCVPFKGGVPQASGIKTVHVQIIIPRPTAKLSRPPWERGQLKCKNQSNKFFAIKSRTEVTLNNLRHRKQHSKQPFKHRKKDEICLSVCAIRCYYCVKRVVSSPMFERTVVCGKFCETEGCCSATPEQSAKRLLCPCAGRFCSFLGLKKEIREFRLNKEQLTGHRGVERK